MGSDTRVNRPCGGARFAVRNPRWSGEAQAQLPDRGYLCTIVNGIQPKVTWAGKAGCVLNIISRVLFSTNVRLSALDVQDALIIKFPGSGDWILRRLVEVFIGWECDSHASV